MANYTFDLINVEISRAVLRMIQIDNTGTRFEARIVITGDRDGLTVGTHDSRGRLLRETNAPWEEFITDPSCMIAGLERENRRLRDRVCELERSAGLRS